MPTKEDYISFTTQGTAQKQQVTFCRIHKLCEKCDLPYGYFNGKEIIHDKSNINIKKKKKRKNDCTNDYCVIRKSKGVSLSKPVEEVRENFEYE